MHGGVHRNFPPKVVLQQSGWEFGAAAYLAGVMWLLQSAGVAATSAQQPTSNLFSFIEPGAASASSLVSPCTAAPTFGLVAGGNLGGWQRRESAASRRPAAACHRSLRAIGAAWSPAGAVKHGALAQTWLPARGQRALPPTARTWMPMVAARGLPAPAPAYRSWSRWLFEVGSTGTCGESRLRIGRPWWQSTRRTALRHDQVHWYSSRRPGVARRPSR